MHAAVDLYEQALAGEPCWIRDADGAAARMPVPTWIGTHGADTAFDAAVLQLCCGPTIDLGCGPGRFVAELVHRGTPALGVDVSRFAVHIARSKGGPALRRDIFGPLPGAGRWQHVLLMDGNIGIGADPVRLLRRVRDLLGPGGTAIVEFSGPGVRMGASAVRLESRGRVSAWFPWARAGVDLADTLAQQAELRVVRTLMVSGRHLAVIGHAACQGTP